MRRFLAITILLLLLAGCADITALLSTPEPATTSTKTPAPITTPTKTATPTASPSGPRTLRVWIPPQFDPAAETPAGTLLQDRLDEFVARRPGLQIEVRVKKESMLYALTTTQKAAPAIMPDLLALSRADLEAVTAAGLLHPLDGLTTALDDPDWYPYAVQMAHIQNTTFGLPFAGDALALVGYRDPMPDNWVELPKETLLIFPAANPQALYSLSLYLSAGETLSDDQILPTLDETILTELFSFYALSTENDFITPTNVEYQDPKQTWTALREQRGNLSVNWVSTYLQDPIPGLKIAPLPGLRDGYYTLATGWSWALAGSNLENQPLAMELAEFLSDSQFLTEWSQAAGYLPTRPTTLSTWEDAGYKTSLIQTAESAHLTPNQNLVITIGPLFSEAVLSILKGERTPEEAALSIIEQLK